MTRVAIVLHRGGLDGGAERAAQDLIAGLRERCDIEPTAILPSPGPFSDWLESVGVSFAFAHVDWWARKGLPNHRLGVQLRYVATSARKLFEWRSALSTLRADVVLTTSATVSSGAVAARLSGLPHIWWLQEFVDADHGLTYVFPRDRVLQFMARSSDGVIANSQAVLRHFVPPLPLESAWVIPYSIPGRPSAPQPFVGTLRLLLLGHQTPTKGSEDAVRAVAALPSGPPVHLRLVGSGDPEYKQKLAHLARTAAPGNRIDVEDATDRRVMPLSGPMPC